MVLGAEEPIVIGAALDAAADAGTAAALSDPVREIGLVRRVTSLPDQNSEVEKSGRTRPRTRRGVIDRMISVFCWSSRWLEKSLPMTGIAPSPGTRLAVRRSASLMRPASIWVSPSLKRNAVAAVRVPTS